MSLGKPAFVLLDFDLKGIREANLARLEELGGFLGALEMLMPEIKTAGYIRRASTSANLYFMDNFQLCPQAIGEHLYVLVMDGSDAKRFLDTLHDRAWLHGFGWIWLSIAGRRAGALDRRPGGIRWRTAQLSRPRRTFLICASCKVNGQQPCMTAIRSIPAPHART